MRDAETIYGRAFRSMREKHKLSQSALAEAMRDFGYEWQQTTVSKVESGSRPLLFSEAAAVCAVFGEPITALAGRMIDEFVAPGCILAVAELRLMRVVIDKRIAVLCGPQKLPLSAEDLRPA